MTDNFLGVKSKSQKCSDSSMADNDLDSPVKFNLDELFRFLYGR